MRDLPKNWIYLWIGITLITCMMLTAGWLVENWKTVQMAKQGYEEVVLQGRQSFAWQKAK